MDLPSYPLLQKGLALVQAGAIKEIAFGKYTYQIAVREQHRLHWVLLHFTEEGDLKEGFCDCSHESPCVHFAAAYLKVCPPPIGEPLHLGFEHHFFYHFFWLWAQEHGCDPKAFRSTAEGRISADGCCEWHYLDMASRNLVESLWNPITPPTPTNSILFSDVSVDEIQRWKQGRPSLTLQFELSPLAALSKQFYLMNIEKPFHVTLLKPDQPEHFLLTGHGISLSFTFEKDQLSAFIPYLNTISFPLPVLIQQRGPLTGMRMDSHQKTIYLSHTLQPRHRGQPLWRSEKWEFYSNAGFYPVIPHPLLDRDTVPCEFIPELLRQYSGEISKWIPVQKRPTSLSYALAFDSSWDLHITTYVHQPGDLAHAIFVSLEWLYVQETGWMRIRTPKFPHIHLIIPSSQVNGWVQEEKIWLTGQPGFQTHVTTIESRWTYRLKDSLSFLPMEDTTHSEDRKDFGDWVYIRGQGFFAKHLSKRGGISSNVCIPKSQIGNFILDHIEELEHVHQFFGTTLPISHRGLSLRLVDEDTIRIDPVVELLPMYAGIQLEFFDPFVYLPDHGFVRLPKGMELPDGYDTPYDISLQQASYFFDQEFAKLQPHVLHIDRPCTIPLQADLHVRNLSYAADSIINADLYLVSEIGQVSLSQLMLASIEKKEWIATSAGLLDLTAPRFFWLRGLRHLKPTHPIQLDILDWMRLDTLCQIQWIPSYEIADQHTETILRELRGWEHFPLPELSGFRGELRQYQLTGLQWLWYLYSHHLSGLLCDDMGLGKTHQAMALLAAVHSKKGGPFLVVCPTSVLYHWQDKLSTTLPKLDVYLFHGLHRKMPQLNEHSILLTSYGILRMDRSWLQDVPFEVMIYDEVHVAKNPSSQIHEALRSVKGRMRIGLTGTPIENYLRELKAQFDLILPGFLGSDAQFRSQFLIPIEKNQDIEKKLLLRQLIRPFSLRRKKQDVLSELPAKTEDTLLCALSSEQLCLYQNMVHREGAQLIREMKEGEDVPYLHIFAILNYLKQICNHPALYYRNPAAYSHHSSGKWNACIELIEEARASEQKIVIFSQYLQMLDIFQLYLQEQGIGFAEIRGQTTNRKGALDTFHSDPNCQVFLGSLHAAGVGIDLTPASVVILYDRWWNAAKEQQAIDRVHRIGQQWPVQVFKLISPGTIEEQIDHMIQQKAQLMHDIVLPDDQKVIKTLSRDDVIQLLSTLPIDFLEN